METLWVDEFLDEYLNGRHVNLPSSKKNGQRIATRQDLVYALASIEKIYRDNISQKSLNDIVDIIIYSTIEEYEKIREKYGVPGYTASVQVGGINVGIFSGKTGTGKNASDMPENALFDIASMTKLYTQIVVYNLMKEGLFKKSDIIKYLDRRFKKLGNLTVGDILNFSVELKTPVRIDDAITSQEALDRLLGAEIARDKNIGLLKGPYCYTDIGMMIIKEVVETLTGETFDELVNKYIVTPLNLKNTHLIVPEDKYSLITGTPNASIGHVNDMKANMMKGGYSGHAGVFSDYADVMKVLRAARSGIVLPDTKDLTTPSEFYAYNKNTGIYTRRNFNAEMGNVFLWHDKGVDTSWIPNVSPSDSIGTSGSTRVTGIASLDSSYTTLFNPASVGVKEAREMIARTNEEKIKNGKKPVNINERANTVERYIDGEKVNFDYINPVDIMPLRELENAVNEMGQLEIKLRFLDFIIRQKEQDMDYQIDVRKHVN